MLKLQLSWMQIPASSDSVEFEPAADEAVLKRKKMIMMHVSIIKIVKENGQAYRRVETKAY